MRTYEVWDYRLHRKEFFDFGPNRALNSEVAPEWHFQFTDDVSIEQTFQFIHNDLLFHVGNGV